MNTPMISRNVFSIYNAVQYRTITSILSTRSAVAKKPRHASVQSLIMSHSAMAHSRS